MHGNGYNSAGVYKKRNIGGGAQDDDIVLIETEFDDNIGNKLTNPCARSIFIELELEMINKDLL